MSTNLAIPPKTIQEIAGNLQLKLTENSLAKNAHVFFAGSSDAAKTFAVQLAKQTNKQLSTIDLSTFTPGTIEKNLAGILTEAEQKGSILLFDEADALFGKRTDVKDSHDRYANIEISWLLDRIQDYKGTIVLASDHSGTIDPKYLSRFNTILRHPKNA